MSKLVKIQLAIAVPLILVGGFFAFYIYYQLINNLSNTTGGDDQNEATIYYHPLDGTKKTTDNSNIYVVGVMVENHVDARPQAGLSQARVVYEILAEADITRFLAIFDLADDIKKIGPVRSARPYYIDIASEYKAIYAHSGGSDDALDRLRRDDLVINLDEFFGYNTGYFWRDNGRYAPHNLYTSVTLLLAAKDHYNVLNNTDFMTWQFRDGMSETGQETEIKINYSDAPSYQITWQYSQGTNRYERWQNKARHVDEDGTIIEADNIILQYVDMKILDDIGRKDIQLLGSGKSVIFKNGLSIDGTWQKKDSATRTVFYDETNKEIEFNRGKIWIEVVSAGIDVVY